MKSQDLQEPRRKSAGPQLSGSILVVDDNRMNRLMLARSLELQGHQVSFAENGQQALEILRDQAHDLILLDIEMPEMNGYEVLEQLNANPHWRDIPVIMISAVDEIDSVVKCIEMGAADYLNKPFNPVLLKARVGASLEKKRLLDEQRDLFRRFATDEVADELMNSGFSLGGSLVDATVSFCDIRSFTTLAESQSPEDTIELLNAYYAMVIEATASEGGIVSLMAGDGVMSIFGAPLPQEDHRQRSVRGAGDDPAYRAVQSRASRVEAHAYCHWHRDRLGDRYRRLCRDPEACHVYLHRRYGQSCRPPRIAYQSRRSTYSHRREHLPGFRWRGAGLTARSGEVEG